ncbi:hypothetical protein RI844_07185 [Thalassotalea fonticola]|uniref:PqqD family peptide modification chaperone n=1 Tax=Thalassotalea fonticola TaxID=3065649 RepID=A0ABZ0GSR4_9GAMM|nr:hypothetical protein RI844_07185 [Colwelliaceae bacterium S1-1]
MQFEKIQLNAPHLTLWLSENKGLVFHQGQKTLLQIEPISIALLIALDEGLTNQQAVIELQQHSNLTEQQLTQSLEQVKPLFKNTEGERSYADGLYPELQNHISQQPQQHSFCLTVANATFAITSDDEGLLNEIKALLTPIEITAPEEVHFAIHIEIYKGNYLLVSNDIVVEEGLSQQQVMPVFIDRLQILAYQHSDYCFGFHGAALTNRHSQAQPCHSRLVRESTSEASENTTILLPGVSGAGKSTLTAELSRQDFSVYSDEIIALNNDFNLTTLALPMAIKSGSWQHIAKLYPEIKSQPEWHRVDGRILKYIWPEHIAEKTEMDYRLRGNDEDEGCGNDEEDNRHSLATNSHSQVTNCHSQAPSRHSRLVRESTSEAQEPKSMDPRMREDDAKDTRHSGDVMPNSFGHRESTETTNKTFLISPKFNKDATPKATKLTIIDTLKLVTEGGYQLGVELTEDRVEQLIDFCEHIQAYQITYASSEQAQHLINNLVR